MTTYLLDTSVLIDCLRGKNDRAELLRGLVENGNTLACCAINISEVYAGMRDQEERQTFELLESLEYFDITWEIARMAGLLKRDFAKKGRPLTLTDTTIAAVCMANSLTLVTDNLKDFPMPGLLLYTFR